MSNPHYMKGHELRKIWRPELSWLDAGVNIWHWGHFLM